METALAEPAPCSVTDFFPLLWPEAPHPAHALAGRAVQQVPALCEIFFLFQIFLISISV